MYMHMLRTGDYNYFPNDNFFPVLHLVSFDVWFQTGVFEIPPFVFTFRDVRTMKVCFILSFLNQTVYEPFSSEDDV